MAAVKILTLLPLLALSATANPILSARKLPTCPLTIDARIPSTATGADFDTGGIVPFNAAYDLGADQTWADVLRFPRQPRRSIFDVVGTKAVEVTLSDESVFAPSADNVQRGFRRSELLPNAPGGGGEVSGVKTWHLSLKRDEGRGLNYSHEYYLFWLEAADYSHNPFVLGTGALFGNGANSTTGAAAEQLWLRSNDASSQFTIFQTPFTAGVWHNVALTFNFHANTIQVYYSKGQNKLRAQGGEVGNDLSNGGQYHIGMLKKPTGTGLGDISREGFQEGGIDEGIIFGGGFEEDSADGCVSLGGSAPPASKYGA